MCTSAQRYGWHGYHHEIRAAITAAGLNKLESIVMQEVFDQVFGFDPSPIFEVILSPTVIGQRWGCDRVKVDRALVSLAASGILAWTGYCYRFVPELGQWRRGDRPRFTLKELAAIANAASYPLIPPTR